MQPKNHYDNLKVARDAPTTVIRAAYRTLAQQYHPDKSPPGDEKSARIMTILNLAYAVLSDPEKRLEHDNWIAAQEAREKQKFNYSSSKPQPHQPKHNSSQEIPSNPINATRPPPKQNPGIFAKKSTPEILTTLFLLSFLVGGLLIASQELTDSGFKFNGAYDLVFSIITTPAAWGYVLAGGFVACTSGAFGSAITVLIWRRHRIWVLGWPIASLLILSIISTGREAGIQHRLREASKPSPTQQKIDSDKETLIAVQQIEKLSPELDKNNVNYKEVEVDKIISRQKYYISSGLSSRDSLVFAYNEYVKSKNTKINTNKQTPTQPIIVTHKNRPNDVKADDYRKDLTEIE